MEKQGGFSLIELLIVVAIILIVAAIAIPNMIRAKMAANESSAAGSIRAIATAEVIYSNAYGLGYASIDRLGGTDPCVAAPMSACLIDSSLSRASHVKSGYVFTAVPSAGAGTTASPFQQYTATANTTGPAAGIRSFFTDETGVIRYTIDGTKANAGSLAMQ